MLSGFITSTTDPSYVLSDTVPTMYNACRMFPLQEKLDEPHYAVLPDAYENHELQTYVTQDDIEIVSNRKVLY